MKVVKPDAPPEKALQELEDVLQKHKMQITHGYRGFEVSFGGQSYELRDIEMYEGSQSLPRMVDSERMVLQEG